MQLLDTTLGNSNIDIFLTVYIYVHFTGNPMAIRSREDLIKYITLEC